MASFSDPAFVRLPGTPEQTKRDSGGTVSVVNPLEVDGWDSLVMEHPGFSFFHSAAWAAVLADTFHFTPCYLLARDDAGTPTALRPVMEVRSAFTGRRGVGLPFTDECPQLTFPGQREVDLFQRALEYGRSQKWRSFECRGEGHTMGQTPPSVCFFRHELDLTGGVDAVFAGFEGSVRQAIRKAGHAGVVVAVSHSLESVRRFYSLYCLTRQRHGLPPQRFSLFQNVHRHILSKNKGFIVQAMFNGLTIAAAVFFAMGRKAVYKFGASHPAWQSLRGNNLVCWEAIQRLGKEGYESLHFGRTSITNEGLRRYKNGWGCDETMMRYFKFDLRRNRFLVERDRASGWHNRLFRAMPLPLARAFGFLLYRHVA